MSRCMLGCVFALLVGLSVGAEKPGLFGDNRYCLHQPFPAQVVAHRASWSETELVLQSLRDENEFVVLVVGHRGCGFSPIVYGKESLHPYFRRDHWHAPAPVGQFNTDTVHNLGPKFASKSDGFHYNDHFIGSHAHIEVEAAYAAPPASDAALWQVKRAFNAVKKANPGDPLWHEKVTIGREGDDIVLAIRGWDGLSDLRGLEGVPVNRLTIDKCTSLRSLDGLQGMPLHTVTVANCPVVSLKPLTGAPLRKVSLRHTLVEDLAPLSKARLQWADFSSTRISELSPLKGMPLVNLYLGGTNVADLSPLRGMPIKSLNLCSTRIDDLSPLAGMPLHALYLRNLRVKRANSLPNLPQLTILDVRDTVLADLPPARQGMVIVQ